MSECVGGALGVATAICEERSEGGSTCCFLKGNYPYSSFRSISVTFELFSASRVEVEELVTSTPHSLALVRNSRYLSFVQLTAQDGTTNFTLCAVEFAAFAYLGESCRQNTGPVHVQRLASRETLRVEPSEGWTGLCFADTQILSGDPYVGLAVAAAVTEELRIGIGVTNPWTRHPVVTASAIESANLESGGRVELGIGRGDSSLAYLGLAPRPFTPTTGLRRDRSDVPSR